MLESRFTRRALALAAGLLAAGAAGGTVASSALAIDGYGSGAAVQRQLHQNVWLPASGASLTYTPTNAVSGFQEFGVDTGVLDITKDPTANALIPPQYDGFTAVDSGPTGPGPGATFTPQRGTGTELENAAFAANGSSSRSRIVTVPVGQTLDAILLSLPSTVTLASTARVNLTGTLLGQLFAGTVPAAGGYAANTWGALLTTARTAFTGTGGSTGIGVQLRTNGAGATLNLKQYLSTVDPTDWRSPVLVDDSNTQGTNEWPSGATQLGPNASDSNEAQATANTAGSVGYSTLGSAANLTGGGAFGETPTTYSGHQILFARLQDNNGHSPATFASPATGTAGDANIYTGANINVNGSGGVGNWIVPTTTRGGSTFDPTGTWSLSKTNPAQYTHAWDGDVFTNSGGTTHYYPLSIALFVLSWQRGSWNTGNLSPQGVNAEATTKSYLQYATGAGQTPEATSAYYYDKLPTGGSGLADIAADAALAAAAL